LVAESISECTTNGERVEALIRLIRSRCHYRLGSHVLPEGAEATEHFLFTQPEGWCVHFASALAVMAREAGIPARVVNGYGPGENDPVAGNILVTDRDAHAWVEVCLDGETWNEFDPTPPSHSPLMVPERLAQERDRWVDRGLWLDRMIVSLGVRLQSVGEAVAQAPAYQAGLVLSVLLVILMVMRVRGRQVRELYQRLWQDIRGGTPRTAARAAYSLCAFHLERYGWGREEKTAPGEYVERLHHHRSAATDAFGAVVRLYEQTAFGPQVSMRWNRKLLVERCEEVLKRLKRRKKGVRNLFQKGS
jgi:hypothetical protein